MSYFPKPSLNENDLAIIERGDTAIHSIEAGQYVSWKGRTGKAKAAILQGATLIESLFDYEEDGTLNALNSNSKLRFYMRISDTNFHNIPDNCNEILLIAKKSTQVDSKTFTKSYFNSLGSSDTWTYFAFYGVNGEVRLRKNSIGIANNCDSLDVYIR